VANADHIILCGGTPAPRRADPDSLVRLDLGGDEPSVDLEIDNISRRLSSAVPDILTDLIEIASYVYCADQAVTRGGEGVLAFGAQWRRNFVFHIPVRRPSIWSSPAVLHALQRTLAILSEDNYEFHFVQRIKAVPMQQYLTLGDGDSTAPELDEVLLFSGGLDSLGGTVQEAVVDKRRVALVSHRSNSKVFSRQKKLVSRLHEVCQKNPPLHVPVWVHQSGTEGREYTQRSRTFLYASLGAAVARVFGLKRIRFYENGVVSLNLPISEQVVGARATRTTHPQVLDGFANLFSLLVEETFTVENPFLWITKTEVVNLIGDAGCGELIAQSVSCTHTREQTTEKPHCGRCSQCISRKFATLASRFSNLDPGSLYHLDLLTDPRTPEKDRTLVESFIRTATLIGSMNELQVVEHYGEVSRVLRHVRPLSADQVAERVIQLYRRHSAEVTGVMDGALRDHASDIREGKLPATCAILLAIPESYKKAPAVETPESPGAPKLSATPTGSAGSTEGRQRMELPAWLTTEGRSEHARQRPPEKGSLDRPLQTDPIWTITVPQKGPIPVTRLSGEVEWIDSSAPKEPDGALLPPEEEQRIADVTLSGRSELRSEIEKLFSGPDWPLASAVIEPFRRYATKVFDANAAAYRKSASMEAGDAQDVLTAMARNLLSDVFGSEWESSPGEKVTRIDWQTTADGWKGREINVLAGDDPDKNCVYHQLVGDAVMYRYRFHAVIPPPNPGEPPGINSSNLEWWQYIGLNERHNLAMAIKPYIEDRVAHWRSICSSTSPVNADGAGGGATSNAPKESKAEPGTVVAHTPIAATAHVSRKRGRPAAIDNATKDAALAVKAGGGTGRDIAKVLYKTLYPNSQQVKNAPNILKHYLKSASPSPNNS
jgi:hypothetical protein